LEDGVLRESGSLPAEQRGQQEGDSVSVQQAETILSLASSVPFVLAAGNSWNASHMPGKRINKCKESGISRAVENSECTCVLSTAGLTIILDILGLSVGNTQVSGNLNGENENLNFG